MYLCFKDAFHLPHKYMYLPNHKVDSDFKNVVFDDSPPPTKHDGCRFESHTRLFLC